MRYVRVEPVETLVRAEGVLVLYERELVQLSPLGGEMFAACAEERTLGELTEHLTAVFGRPPGDPEEATRIALDRGVRGPGRLEPGHRTDACPATVGACSSRL